MSGDDRDYKLDISSLPGPQRAPNRSSERPFLSVLFACCGVYQRIYRDASATEYRGRCPRCGKPVRFAVAESGTSARFFRVS